MFFLKLKWWWQLSIISLLALIIYAPILGNSFVNDDYIVIKRVCIDGQLTSLGFFRPLSDLSILLTCQIFGPNPLFYYLTGVFLHAVSAFLFFQLCKEWKWTADEERQKCFALFAGALFLTYPFHNESVAWILGRGALMADTLCILALLVLIRPGRRTLKIIGVCVCYFIGLAVYETIIVLPAMVLIYLLLTGNKQIWVWMLALGITLGLHLWLRIGISGSLAGEYGALFLNSGAQTYIANFAKAFGRTLLPPMGSTTWLIVLFIAIIALITGVLFNFRKQLFSNNSARIFLYLQVAFFTLSLFIPAMASVSTHTSESDRLLHLPSYFLCATIAFVLVSLPPSFKWPFVILFTLIGFNLYQLERNNQNWRKASESVRQLIGLLRQEKGKGKIYIINLPTEINGAYVFRVGFQEALLVNKIDTAEVEVLSRLSWDEALIQPPVISYQKQGTSIEIPPSVQILQANGKLLVRKKSCNNCISLLSDHAVIIYWDRRNWAKVPLKL